MEKICTDDYGNYGVLPLKEARLWRIKKTESTFQSGKSML